MNFKIQILFIESIVFGVHFSLDIADAFDEELACSMSCDVFWIDGIVVIKRA